MAKIHKQVKRRKYIPEMTCFYKRSDCICDVLRDLVPFAQFKKCEKHP